MITGEIAFRLVPVVHNAQIIRCRATGEDRKDQCQKIRDIADILVTVSDIVTGNGFTKTDKRAMDALRRFHKPPTSVRKSKKIISAENLLIDRFGGELKAYCLAHAKNGQNGAKARSFNRRFW